MPLRKPREAFFSIVYDNRLSLRGPPRLADAIMTYCAVRRDQQQLLDHG